MSALDMAPILSSTGLFADRVPSIIPLELFRGRAISDTLHGSRGLLFITQASMYGADPCWVDGFKSLGCSIFD
ncbi:MAG: hypothetical protein R2774_01370 [Saprospiraceae bacterium]